MQRMWFAGFVIILIVRLATERLMQPRNTEPRPSPRGRISLQMLTLPYLISAFATGFMLWRGDWTNPLLHGVGLVLFGAGFAGRAFALRRLGRSYSPYVDPAPTETLQTQGIYAHLRHPLYAFYLLEALALAVILPNRVSLASFVVIALAVAWRIRAEEAALLSRYREEYREYMKRSYRLLPWVY